MPTYGKITTNITRHFDEVFDESNYDDSLYITKESFKHSEPSLSFSYRYAFRVFECDDGKFATELLLAIEPKSYCKAKREAIADSCGIGVDDVLIEDAIGQEFCGAIPFDSELVEADKLDEAKDTVASALFAYDGMRGFWLDRSVNAIGTTGWDLVKEAKGRIKDALKYTIRKYSFKKSA